MANESCRPPVMCPQEFYEDAHHAVLSTMNLDLFRDVCVNNCVQLYLFLVQNLQLNVG